MPKSDAKTKIVANHPEDSNPVSGHHKKSAKTLPHVPEPGRIKPLPNPNASARCGLPNTQANVGQGT
jgi:hypothetical protein